MPEDGARQRAKRTPKTSKGVFLEEWQICAHRQPPTNLHQKIEQLASATVPEQTATLTLIRLTATATLTLIRLTATATLTLIRLTATISLTSSIRIPARKKPSTAEARESHIR